MGIFLLLAVTAAFAAGSSSKAAGATGPSAAARLGPIVAFGDSLTSGYGLPPDGAYPAALERMLRAAGLPLDVVNHGVSSDTTTRAVPARRGGGQPGDAAADLQPLIAQVTSSR